MMTDQPSLVTPAEISDLLSAARHLSPDASFGEQIAYFERKAELLSGIAADMNTANARAAAAEAWAQVAALAAQLRQKLQDNTQGSQSNSDPLPLSQPRLTHRELIALPAAIPAH